MRNVPAIRDGASERESRSHGDEQHRGNPRFAAVVAIDDGDVAVLNLTDDAAAGVVFGGDHSAADSNALADAIPARPA